MIRLLKTVGEIDSGRAWLRAGGIDFGNPARLRPWRWVYALRYRTAAPLIDVLKSWDVANIVSLIEARVPDRREAILDMGCFNSEILYALHALGYRRLFGCDLNPMCAWMPYWHAIRYDCCDITATPYPDSSFSAVACVSVIEHGVPVARFADEVKRLLRPGGLIVFTTDYDGSGARDAVDSDVRFFGQPWRIFDHEGLLQVCREFTDRGFRFLETPSLDDFQGNDRPIAWGGHEYTFALVALVA